MIIEIDNQEVERKSPLMDQFMRQSLHLKFTPDRFRNVENYAQILYCISPTVTTLNLSKSSFSSISLDNWIKILNAIPSWVNALNLECSDLEYSPKRLKLLSLKNTALHQLKFSELRKLALSIPRGLQSLDLYGYDFFCLTSRLQNISLI